MVEVAKHPQFIGQADNRPNIKDQVRKKEAPQSPEQKQFFDKYQQEAQKANFAEKQANQYAREQMVTMESQTLRKIGIKQLAWGIGLQFINVGGAFLGMVGGGLGAMAVLGSGGWLPTLGILTVAGAGWVGGALAGSEIVRGLYDKLVTKIDKSLPKIKDDDRALGGLLSVVAGWNPPMVAGGQNLIEGYHKMKALR